MLSECVFQIVLHRLRAWLSVAAIVHCSDKCAIGRGWLFCDPICGGLSTNRTSLYHPNTARSVYRSTGAEVALCGAQDTTKARAVSGVPTDSFTLKAKEVSMWPLKPYHRHKALPWHWYKNPSEGLIDQDTIEGTKFARHASWFGVHWNARELISQSAQTENHLVLRSFLCKRISQLVIIFLVLYFQPWAKGAFLFSALIIAKPNKGKFITFLSLWYIVCNADYKLSYEERDQVLSDPGSSELDRGSRFWDMLMYTVLVGFLS